MITTFAVIDKVTSEPLEVARRVELNTFNPEKSIYTKVTITALGEISLFILRNMAPETEVIAMDNNSQGIRTIGDIINHPGFVEIDWLLLMGHKQ